MIRSTALALAVLAGFAVVVPAAHADYREQRPKPGYTQTAGAATRPTVAPQYDGRF
jgi:hypothetical protein